VGTAPWTARKVAKKLFKHFIFFALSWIIGNTLLAYIVGILIVVAIGGIIEIVPLFYLKNTIEKVEGMRPYTPLELAGQQIYVREGCHVCHSPMIRPLGGEVERYGHYSPAAGSMYDHPFQWGSKRTGPDLARVGGRYSNDWHVAHLASPRAVVPESIMPAYPFLADKPLDYSDIAQHLKTLRAVGTPYTDEMIANAKADLEAQVDPDRDPTALEKRYPRAVVGKFNGNTTSITEMDALVSYLQMLGTLVSFGDLPPERLRQ